MDRPSFFYRVFRLNPVGEPQQFLGTAFPVAPDGGLLTCRHVTDSQPSAGESLAVLDDEADRLVRVEDVRYPADADLDIAFIPNALQRSKAEFFPVLTPDRMLIGEDVYSVGYFLAGGERTRTQAGYFKGNIVNFSKAPTSDHGVMTLSYPIVEGLSGAPVLTYHNGPKVVGLAFGSISSRVTAAEVVEYQDDDVTVRETVSRIVEFGLGYQAHVLIRAAEELAIDLEVTDGQPDIPGLG